MNSKELCLRILRATSESAVTEIIDADLDLSSGENWTPVDNRDTNFNVITNQASTGGKALTELCTNMVDAVLMKHAYERGIAPTGPAAPKSVLDGVRELVQLRGARSGRLSEVDDERYLRGFAESNLVIGVHGGTRRDDHRALPSSTTVRTAPRRFRVHIPLAQQREQVGHTICPRQVQHGVVWRSKLLRSKMV